MSGLLSQSQATFGKAVIFICFSLIACVRPPARHKADSAKRSKVSPPAKVVPDTTVSLQKLEIADEISKAFDFSLASEIAWQGTSGEAVFSHADGRTVSYSQRAGAWSSVVKSINQEGYEPFFDFRGQGLFAFKAEQIIFRSADSVTITAVKPDDMGENRLGVNPGFISTVDKNQTAVIASDGRDAKRVALKGIPPSVITVYPCNTGCFVWAYDGTKIFTYSDSEEVWKASALKLELPGSEKVARLAIRFRESDMAIESLIARAESGAVFLAASLKPVKEKLAWDKDIKNLAESFCVPCHLDDGFSKEAVWKQLKTTMIDRLKTTDKGAMPPSETKLGKEMSPGDKAILVEWLSSVEEGPAGEEVGEVGQGSGDKDTGGDLKAVSETYCLSCHSDAKRESFWKNKRNDIQNRVNSNDMPRGMTMPDDQKKKLLDALNAL